MSDYMTAYRDRLERNQASLIQLIKEVQEKDPAIEAYVYDEQGSRLIGSVTFFKGELINRIGFHEVPYRWSGCGYGEHSRSHSGGDNIAMPFSADDALTTFHPIEHNSRTKDKATYLKWYSFLKNTKTILMHLLECIQKH